MISAIEGADVDHFGHLDFKDVKASKPVDRKILPDSARSCRTSAKLMACSSAVIPRIMRTDGGIQTSVTIWRRCGNSVGLRSHLSSSFGSGSARIRCRGLGAWPCLLRRFP